MRKDFLLRFASPYGQIPPARAEFISEHLHDNLVLEYFEFSLGNDLHLEQKGSYRFQKHLEIAQHAAMLIGPDRILEDV